MNPYITISGRKIGIDYPPLVIAEIGINHEGSLTVAKEMVDAAHRAGVEVVKHQTHIVEDEMSKQLKVILVMQPSPFMKLWSVALWMKRRN
jgi:N-acetylneuraminate synthase